MFMAYTVKLKPSAVASLTKLPQDLQKTIGAKISELEQLPRPYGAKKLKSSQGYLRIRTGDYRIIYEVDDKKREVLVRVIGHRRDVYRGSK